MKLRHPHVISLREVFLTQQHLVLVMEFAPGGDLFTYVRSRGGLPEAEARWFFQQIVIAIDYCHRLGVCSRDIKLENTLLDATPGPNSRPLVKLCDFGFSKDSNYHSAPGSRVGTPAYLAPEVIVAAEGTRYDGAAADLWSLGVLLYVMVCGAYPFRRRDDDSMRPPQRMDVLLRRIQAVDYDFPPDRVVSDGCKDLVKRLLVRDPAQRATLAEVMRHPWFQEGLSPEVLSFNDPLVAKSLAEPVTGEVESEIARIVDEAGRGIALRGNGTVGGTGGAAGSAYMDEVDALILQNDTESTDIGQLLDQI
jgi:serine/threonine-protein kinase SRK2